MEVLPYLDIHSHQTKTRDDSICVSSLSVDDLLAQKVGPHHSTAGIHPWWFEDLSSSEIEELKINILQLLEKNLLWGIGETGLDRTMPELMDMQKEMFMWHLDLAEKYNLPLIIHNVRAGSDFLEILKIRRPKVPWIFHDFRGNESLVKDLLRLHQRCFFSFGISLDNSPQVREVLPFIPLEHLFLETDAQKHLDIHDIYLRAAGQLSIEVDYLKSQIWHNFKKLSPIRH